MGRLVFKKAKYSIGDKVTKLGSSTSFEIIKLRNHFSLSKANYFSGFYDIRCECGHIEKNVTESVLSRNISQEHILPCPFCGSDPVFPAVDEVVGTCYYAGCEDCGIVTFDLQIIDFFEWNSAPSRAAAHESWDKEKVRYGDEFIKIVRDWAILKWNTRT